MNRRQPSGSDAALSQRCGVTFVTASVSAGGPGRGLQKGAVVPLPGGVPCPGVSPRVPPGGLAPAQSVSLSRGQALPITSG